MRIVTVSPYCVAAMSGMAVAAVFVPVVSAVAADVQPHPGMLRYPDVGKSHIVFGYANDLWLVPREGGTASPLVSPPGQELFAKFSADGETIAFVGNYDGNRDLYTISTGGGIPVRVTHHPAGETLCDWTPDGGLLFYSNGQSGLRRMPKLYTVASAGGLPQQVPVPYGAAGAISADGEWLAYTPHTRDARTWKRYRGGMATDIWLFNLSDLTSRKITDWEGTDTLPMWHGDSLYYLSDRGEGNRLNLWSYDLGDDEHEQVTRYADYDVKWPSIGPGDRGQGEIIFQNGAKLYLLDLRTRQSREVSVTIPGARPTIRNKRVDAAKFARWWQISSTGKRAVVEARGDVWTLPAENGSPRNLTRTSGVAEREPSWSPDKQWIAYFSDATGEYELYITQSDGKGETKQLTSNSETYYYDPIWSPDSKYILFTDKAAQLYLHTIESGETKIIDKDPWGARPRPNWSHDSQWITYAKTDDNKPVPAVWLYNVQIDEHHQVTSGMFGDASPVFDRKGDYLYFASSRTFRPTYSDVDTTFIYKDSQNLIAVPLRTDVDAPWLAESDEEDWKDEDEEEEAEDEAADDEDADAEEAEADEGDDDDGRQAAVADDGVSGTWDCIVQTPEGAIDFTLSLTLHADNTVTGSATAEGGTGPVNGTYDPEAKTLSLTVNRPDGSIAVLELKIEGSTMTGTADVEGVVLQVTATRTSGGGDDDKDADEDEDARETVEIEIEDFESRAFSLPVPNGSFGQLAVNNKNQLIYARLGDGDAGIKLFDLKDDKKEEKSVVTGATTFEISSDGKKLLVIRGNSATIQKASAGATGKKVVTAGMNVSIDPREEWRQLFTEAWRLYRDFFYVANLHGVDWPAVREHYTKMLDDCITREDVSYVIREMIAELNVGHAYYRGGDVESQPSVSVGMLGVDWELDNGAYRVGSICGGAPWDVDARGPLSAQGIDVNEGDYLLAVNGVPVDTSKDPWAAFVGLAGRTITITVSEKPELDDDARDVVVKTISNESNLRYRAWIEHNRAYVDEKSGGEVGYIYVPNTGINGQSDLVRQFFGQIDKKALIIDERWNGGGQIPTRFIEILNRPVTNYWARRDSKDWTWPPDAHHGPKCMLINGLAGSGGDLFPWYFRQAGLGKIIGTRTWGGLVGISGNPRLIDGGAVTVPTFGFYEKDGTWGVEGHGVDPDIEVIDDPALMVDGGDPQLDAAIELMLAEIEANPYTPPTRPKDPDRSGMGVSEEDK